MDRKILDAKGLDKGLRRWRGSRKRTRGRSVILGRLWRLGLEDRRKSYHIFDIITICPHEGRVR